MLPTYELSMISFYTQEDLVYDKADLAGIIIHNWCQLMKHTLSEAFASLPWTA